MRQSKRRRRIIGPKQGRDIRPTACRGLVLIDAEPIKKAEQGKCQQTIRKMDRAREDLKRFNEKSQPAFNQWLHVTFGKEITKLRELAGRHHELQRLLSEIEEYKDLFGGSYHNAYESVMKRKSQHQDDSDSDGTSGDSGQESEEDFEDTNQEHDEQLHRGRRDGAKDGGCHNHRCGFSARQEAEFMAEFEICFGPRHRWRGPKAEYDAMFRQFIEMFGNIAGDFEQFDAGADEAADDAFGASSYGGNGPDFKETLKDFDGYDKQAMAEQKSLETRLKDLYRTLVRRLHPDVNPDVDQKRKDLWYDVQSAYEAKDLERLETLSAMGDIYDDNVQSIGSVWSLKKLLQELKSGFRRLQQQIRRIKEEPAWDFEVIREQPKKFRGLHDTIARQMEYESDQLETAIYGDSIIEEWKQPPKSKRSRSPRRTRTPHVPKMTQKHQQSSWTKADMDAFTGFGD